MLWGILAVLGVLVLIGLTWGLGAISVTYVSQCSIVETLTGSFISSGDNTVTINGMNTTTTLTASTTPAATKGTAFTKTLSSGAGTIDLTSLPGLTADETISGSGLKVRMVKLANPSSNANSITVTPGASNGYNLFGASFVLVISPGQEHMAYLDDDAPSIDSTHKTIDLAGTGSQTLNVEFVMG